MGQGAHHLGTSPAPVPRNSMSEQGMGASSLPAPPLVTTRAGPGELARGPTPMAAAAQGYSTRSAGAGTRHMGPGGVRTDERHRQSRCRGWDAHGAMPGGPAPGSKAAAATHHRPQRTFRLNLRPARARRLSEAGWHSAPIARQRATREERHSGLAWPAYCNKSKRAPPVLDGMRRTVAQGGERCPPENDHLHPRVFGCPATGGADGIAGMSRSGHLRKIKVDRRRSAPT
jgi:hypothetical protein